MTFEPFFPVIIDPLERFWTVSSFRLAVPDHFWMFFCRTNRKNNDFLGAKNLKKKSTKTKKTKIVYFRFWSQNRFPAGEKIDFFSIFRNSRKYFFRFRAKKSRLCVHCPMEAYCLFPHLRFELQTSKQTVARFVFQKKKRCTKTVTHTHFTKGTGRTSIACFASLPAMHIVPTRLRT